MPILRWFGFSRRVTSLPPMTIVPEVGSSKPATMRSIVVLPQPDGPRKDTNSPGATSRLNSLTTTVWPKAFLTSRMDGEEALGHGSLYFGALAGRGAKREERLMRAIRPRHQVMAKAMTASAAGS